MSPEQIELVQKSFRNVMPIKDVAASLFYERLFTLDPTLQPLFKSDMVEQRQKLMAALATVVGALHKVDEVVPTIQGLAERHVAYGVKPEHYDTVGEALLWTLGKGLGDDFTAEVEEAWAAAYGLLSSVMIEAADQKVA